MFNLQPSEQQLQLSNEIDSLDFYYQIVKLNMKLLSIFFPGIKEFLRRFNYFEIADFIL